MFEAFQVVQFLPGGAGMKLHRHGIGPMVKK